MPEAWTGEVVGQLHVMCKTQADLAAVLDMTPEYVSMVLNGRKNPSGAEERFRAALKALEDGHEDG